MTLDGTITQVNAFDNIVPTGLAVRGKTVYMAEAGPSPHLPENGKIVSSSPDRTRSRRWPSAVASSWTWSSARDTHLFALAQGEFTPGTRRFAREPEHRQTTQGQRTGGFAAVAEGLNQPTSLEFIGKSAYIVTLGGEIWKIDDLTS